MPYASSVPPRYMKFHIINPELLTAIHARSPSFHLGRSNNGLIRQLTWPFASEGSNSTIETQGQITNSKSVILLQNSALFISSLVIVSIEFPAPLAALISALPFCI